MEKNEVSLQQRVALILHRELFSKHRKFILYSEHLPRRCKFILPRKQFLKRRKYILHPKQLPKHLTGKLSKASQIYPPQRTIADALQLY